MPRELPPGTISVGRIFEVDGIPVREIIRKPKGTKENIFDLTWVRHPIEEEQIDGKDNNYFHAHYGKNERQNAEYVRKIIKELFLKYWGRVKLWVPPGTDDA